jgi:hypothetical protein
MARSVSHASGSVHIEYSHVEPSDDYDNFDWLIEDFQDVLHDQFPSVYPCKKWVGREDQAIAANKFAYFGISTYDSLVSIWVTPKEVDPTQEGIRDRWIESIGGSFTKVARSSFGTPIIKVGSFSNGEAVFRAVE